MCGGTEKNGETPQSLQADSRQRRKCALPNTNPARYLHKRDDISCNDVLSTYLRTRMTLESGKPRVIWTMTPQGWVTRRMWQAATQVAPTARLPGASSEVCDDLQQRLTISRSSVKTTCEPEHCARAARRSVPPSIACPLSRSGLLFIDRQYPTTQKATSLFKKLCYCFYEKDSSF
jgi:hypothetical protein